MHTPTGLHRLSLFVAGLTFVLLVAGGLVTSTGSGLSVPDWPLSYGQFFPPLKGGVLYEHGHRMIAGIVGLCMIALAVWLGFKEPRPWVRRVGTVALFLVVIQALLGGLTVLFLLPPAVSIAHACVGPTVFCLVVCLAFATAPSFSAASPPLPLASGTVSIDQWLRVRLLRRAAILTTAVLYMQLILGAILRHTRAGLIPHLIGAAVVSFHVGLLIVRALRLANMARPDLRRYAWWLGGLLLVQILSGGGALAVTMGRPSPNTLMDPHVLLPTAHMAAGTLMLAFALILTFRIAWTINRGEKGESRGWLRGASVAESGATEQDTGVAGVLRQ